MNLKDETLEIMAEHGKTKEDIVWIGCRDFAIGPATFWRLADRMYDSGYGWQEVATDLLVVGDNWWMERHEYDGSEWWEYKEPPKMPFVCKDVQRIIRGPNQTGWSKLAEMNEEGKQE